jgi:hypothetical protein
MGDQQDIKDRFSFERKKHFDFFLPFYREKNWQVLEDNIDSEHKNDWDVRLEIFAGEVVLVDEKALRREWDNFLVEIIQDMKTGNLGWHFSKKDWILYGSWDNNEKKYPTSLYLVKAKELKEHIEAIDGSVNTCISKSGWGITWNMTLEWPELLNKNIAIKLIK